MLNLVAKVAIQVGMMAANMALTMSRKIEGPRLDDLKFTSGDYGNPLPMVWGKRRIQTPIFWGEPLREVKRQRKTKGGKYNEYTYYGTWAVALAGHEIDQVLRIWFDTHLVYDFTGAGPVTPFDFGSNSAGSKDSGGAGTDGFSPAPYIAIYYGTETQGADPRIEATTEAAHGEGSCPAYRGTAYIVFKDLPLEKLGNRIPQVAVEFVTAATANYPYETFDIHDANLSRLWGATFSPDYSRFMWASADYYEIWDVAARARMIAGDLPNATGDPHPIAFQSNLALFNDGSFLAAGFYGNEVVAFSADGTTAAIYYSPSFTVGRVQVLMDGAGTEHWLALSTTYLETNYAFDGTETDFTDYFASAWPSWGFVDAEGSVWLAGAAIGATATTAYFLRLVAGPDATGPDSLTITGLHNAGVLGPTQHPVIATHYQDATHDQFVFTFNSHLYAADRFTGAILQDNGSLGLDSYNTDNQFAALVPGSSSIWLGAAAPYELSLADLTVIRTPTMSNWTADDADGAIYDPTNHALITSPTSDPKITWRYLDRAGSDGVTLATIAADLADMVGASGTDFSNLTQVIPGWSATQGQANAILEPLLDAYDSDIRPHGFTLQGLKRTGTSSGTLLTERFKADNPRYSVKVRQAAELPRAITINFADVNADQQPNNVRADRPLDATGARGEKSLDLSTLALAPNDARDLADRYFRRLWNERKEVSLGLTAQQLALEPGDVRTLDLDGEELTARLVKLTIKADDSLATEWVYDHPSLAGLAGGTGANFDGRDPSVIVVPLISKGFVFDIPLLTDVNSSANPLLYIAAAPYASGTWPGATIYRSLSGEYTDEIGSIPSTAPVTWGYVAEALPYTNPNLWDRGSSITVTLQTGTLTGTTEAAIDAAPTLNMAAIGAEGRWEIVNFTTATLTAPNTYALSGFKRGRRGTEWAAELHQAGDQFVLLDTAVTGTLGLSDVGVNQSFKAVTNGRTASGAFPIPVEPFTGASLKPYAPCHLAGVKDSGTGDWALSWVRRTRVGGAWTSGTASPLSEASEAYEVEIMNGSSVVRTVTGLTSPSYSYSAANQTSDFGSGQSSLTFRVYQVSDAVGRGFVASATV